MNLFKLPKPVWKLTDEEYVERARVATSRIRPWSRAASVLWLLLVVAAFLISLKMLGMVLDLPDGPRHSTVLMAYVMGALAGGIMGYTLLKAVVIISEVWAMERVYRIMLMSWDRVKQLERESVTRTEPFKPSPAGSPSP